MLMVCPYIARESSIGDFFMFMRRTIDSGKLTKNTILNKVSQITIFATYFNLSDSLIKHCIDTGELIVSPIRSDKHPTCGFKYDNKGKLKFKDFNGYFWGDCFDAVAYIMSNMYNTTYNVNDKHDFIKILRHITFTFKNIFYGEEQDINLIDGINTAIGNIKKSKPIIEYVTRQWNIDDKEYWKEHGITLSWLNTHFVFPVDQYYIDRKSNPYPKYFYDNNPKDPCYAYFLGKDRNNISNVKLYFPKRNKSSVKFITNCNHLEGIYNLELNHYDYIIITKSTKDRLAIGCIVNYFKIKYSIGVINIPHETYNLRQNEYDWLTGKLDSRYNLISLMDNDRTGKLEAIKLRQNFGIIPMLIPKKYNAKDFSDLVKTHKNVTFIKSIVDDTLTKLDAYVEKYKHLWDKTDSLSLPF